MAEKPKVFPQALLTPKALSLIDLADNSARKTVDVGILLYRNFEVQTHEVFVEDQPFKLVGSDDQLTAAQKPWMHLFTGTASIEVVGGLDVLVRITGQAAPRDTLPQGRAWLIVKVGDQFLEPRLEPACGSVGAGAAHFTYDV